MWHIFNKMMRSNFYLNYQIQHWQAPTGHICWPGSGAMPEVCCPHRQTPEGSPRHTVALDSSLCLSHSHHTNAGFYPVSAELELQSRAPNQTNVRHEYVHTIITTLTVNSVSRQHCFNIIWKYDENDSVHHFLPFPPAPLWAPTVFPQLHTMESQRFLCKKTNIINHTAHFKMRFRSKIQLKSTQLWTSHSVLFPSV